jgi:para-aminobenzoate synthetase/4-amino-4-deoxychorismate lyase
VVGDLVEYYADLAHAQQSRHNAYLDLGTHAVLSASPELFFDWTPPHLHARPMKGTAARAEAGDADGAMRDRLTSSAKDVAENVMIVDLIRNDLGRIARSGTVRVPRLLSVEQYPSVWQLTSDVVAEPEDGTALTDVLAALYPSGSVTGAPKLSAMRMIAALEPSPRGVYCGAVGWLAPAPQPTRARFNVAIRTVTADRRTGVATYGSGGGITICSDPDDEFDELIAKTRVLDLASAATTGQPLELIETLALDAGALRHREHHLARLVASARVFGFPADEHTVRKSLDDAVRGHTSARVALRLAADGTATVRLAPLPVADPAPVRLALDRPSVAPDSVWVRHKTSRRHVYDDALHRHPGAGDVLLVNERGELTESTIANVAVRLSGRWCTPPVSSGCLPGVGRALALAGGRLVERVVTVDDLRAADAVALVSSLRGWRAATIIPGRPR